MPNQKEGNEDKKNPKSVKKVNKYLIHLDQMLGKGAFSKVFLAQDTEKLIPHGKPPAYFAIKEIPNELLKLQLGDKGQETLNKEVHINFTLKHRNIVRLYDYIRTPANNYLVFEYCAGGDLRAWLRD